MILEIMFHVRLIVLDTGVDMDHVQPLVVLEQNQEPLHKLLLLSMDEQAAQVFMGQRTEIQIVHLVITELVLLQVVHGDEVWYLQR
jgi:hypothetical protein